MRHRVRAAALLVRANDGATAPNEILLVKHRSRSRPGNIIWLPPGGGLEAEDSSIFACAERETLEECGLTVKTSRIAYVHEFLDQANQIHHVAFYMAVDSSEGEISLDFLPPDATDALAILEATWVGREDLAELLVYPEYLKGDDFWQDAALNFRQTKYLGQMTKLG
ncbi:MAG: NUDIX hydrolase [Synechococcales cyanobacterium RM1_1_8]|nr:NUDIX hydrolase [Synechococcales cyanobacterium RM1_1_8]NJR71559.1 NUDIX hydrolase [Synechococcales cyanobacterium CRU_2_2]